MSSIPFDTHKFVKRLTEAGMPEAQAEILADEQASLIDHRLATKRDIADIKRDLKELESRLTIRLGGMLVTGIAVVATLIKLL